MGLILSHESALYALRTIRARGIDVRHDVDSIPLRPPSPWVGKRWTLRQFTDDSWNWQVPSASKPLHVLVPQRLHYPRSKLLKAHSTGADLPPMSIRWLDQNAAMPSPAMLFVQMAETLSLQSLTLLGYELCGRFSCDPDNPSFGDVVSDIPPATTVREIQSFIQNTAYAKGKVLATKALAMVQDEAFSVPEAVLGMMYSLPIEELGYGMGPVTLNHPVAVGKAELGEPVRHRAPDLMFSFAPIGLNYDGEIHLDLRGLVNVAQTAALKADDDSQVQLDAKMRGVREKYYDDLVRNRELMAAGRLVVPLVKEDLYATGGLDRLTCKLLDMAERYFGIVLHETRRALEDTELCRERRAFLASVLGSGTGL